MFSVSSSLTRTTVSDVLGENVYVKSPKMLGRRYFPILTGKNYAKLCLDCKKRGQLTILQHWKADRGLATKHTASDKARHK